MPLSKSFTLPNTSISIGYWVVGLQQMNPAGGTIWFVMNGYDSKASYLAGAQPLMQKSYTVPTDSAAACPLPGSPLMANVASYIESKALAQPDFAGATQVA